MNTSYIYECIPYAANPGSGSNTSGGTTTGGATGTVTPIEDVDPLPEEPPTPCSELKKILNNAKVKNAIKVLQTKIGESNEYGYSVTKNIATGTYNIPVPAYASTFSPNEVVMPTGNNSVGGFHTHPPADESWVPMFSDGDLNWLYWVAKDNATPTQDKEYSEFFLTLTVPQGTFAIKIKDWAKFASFRNSKEWVNYYGGRKGVLRKLSRKYDEITATGNFVSMQNGLLEIFRDFDTGIGLYEATPDLNNWNELQLAPNASHRNNIVPLKKPCN